MTKRYSVQQAQSDLPIRKRHDNKTHGGKCLIVGGAPGQWGAGILCAQAAARCGAGYTYIYDPKSTFPVGSHPDFLTLKSLTNLSPFNVIAIGPGLKNSRTIMMLIKRLMKIPKINVVLDAEALNTIAKLKKKVKIPAHWILTPHEGELARLLKTPSAQIKKNREKHVRLAQKLWGGIVVLKGFHTLIADGLTVWDVSTGNAALAKAGTGDVLTGMIAGFLCQQRDPTKATCLAVCAHGLVADRWLKAGRDQLSLLASDLVDRIPETLIALRNKRV